MSQQNPHTTARYRSPGPNQPPVRTETIEKEAIAAAQAGDSLVESCPYPFGSDAGNHFCAVWYLNTNAASNTVNPRPRANPHGAQP